MRMGTTWFTSDLHLGHRLVAELRGFGDDTAAHDAAIAAAWALVVRPEDTVWVLGDVAVTSSSGGVDTVLDQIGALPGAKHLVAGNHDPVHPMHRGAWKWQARYLSVFASVQPFARLRMSTLRVDGQQVTGPVLLSHFPYAQDGRHAAEGHAVDTAAQWRLPDLGGWLLHGHTHSAVQVTDGRQVHVGVDAWGLRPATQWQIEGLMMRQHSVPEVPAL